MTRAVAAVVGLAAVWLGAPATTRAHHSGSEYDQTSVIEITGTLVELAWQNPHVHFGLGTTDAKGSATVWDIEANSLRILRRTDANPDNLKLGDTVRIAGARWRRAPNRMWAMNIMPANGREGVLGPGIRPRWTASAVGSKSTWYDGESEANTMTITAPDTFKARHARGRRSYLAGPHLPTMCGASLSMQTYSPISSFVLRSATLLMTHGFE